MTPYPAPAPYPMQSPVPVQMQNPVQTPAQPLVPTLNQHEGTKSTQYQYANTGKNPAQNTNQYQYGSNSQPNLYVRDPNKKF